jgi:hypothetical protein
MILRFAAAPEWALHVLRQWAVVLWPPEVASTIGWAQKRINRLHGFAHEFAKF